MILGQCFFWQIIRYGSEPVRIYWRWCKPNLIRLVSTHMFFLCFSAAPIAGAGCICMCRSSEFLHRTVSDCQSHVILVLLGCFCSASAGPKTSGPTAILQFFRCRTMCFIHCKWPYYPLASLSIGPSPTLALEQRFGLPRLTGIYL
jgi:hypothetical protein